MARCEKLEHCPFFKHIDHLPRTANQLVISYCYRDNSGCARLWAAKAGVRPPDDLFPNERDRALVLISEAGKSPAAAVAAMSPNGSHTDER